MSGVMRRAVASGKLRHLGTASAAGVIVLWYAFSYRDCVGGFFNWDDFGLLRLAADVRIHSLGDLLALLAPRPTGFFLYRPLVEIYFWVDRLLFGYDASAYHLLQLGVQAANAFLVFLIASRILASRPAGLAAALIYAAAPGHLLAVHWLAAFTMTGTAFWSFICLYVWLRAQEPWRVWACLALFVVALLHGEHAVGLPVVMALAALLPHSRESLRSALSKLLPLYVVAGAYVVAKLWCIWVGFQIEAIDPVARAFMLRHYQMSVAPLGRIAPLGYYVASSLSPLYEARAGGLRLVALGVGAIAATALSAYWAGRSPAGRVAFFGMLFFVICLGPALVLAEHRHGYYVGMAAFGSSLAIVAAAGTVIVGAGAVWRPGMRLPGWRPEWDWLRRLALCGGGEQCEW